MDDVETFILNVHEECKTVLEINEKHENFKILHNNISNTYKNID